MTAAPLRRRLRLAPVVLGVLAAASWLVLSASLWLPPVVGVVPAPVTSLLVRPSYDVLESLALNAGMVVAAVGLSIAALLTTARNWVTVLLCGLVVVAAVVIPKPMSRWSGQTFYAAHAAELAEVVRFVKSSAFTQSPDADTYYGVALPPDLAYLSATGKVSGSARDGVFLPLWTGIPDDAGGLIWAPSGSPAGYDMYGMLCQQPVRVGGDWWSCGVG